MATQSTILLVMNETKRCPRCATVKARSEYSLARNRSDGLQNWCRPCKTEEARGWRAANPEKPRAAARKYYHANPDKHRAWYAANRERQCLLAARLRKAQPYKWRKWAAANREHVRRQGVISSQKRRAIKKCAFVERVDPQVVFGRDAGICGICRQAVSPSTPWHIDHVIPLAKGGPHSYSNVQLAHAWCNFSKGAKLTTTVESLEQRKAG